MRAIGTYVAAIAVFLGLSAEATAREFYVKVEDSDDYETAVIHVQHGYPRVEAKGWNHQKSGDALKYGFGKMETNETFWVFFRKRNGDPVKLESGELTELSKRRVDAKVINGGIPAEWNGAHLNNPNAEKIRDELLKGEKACIPSDTKAKYWCVMFTPRIVASNKNGELKLTTSGEIVYKSPGGQGADVWVVVARLKKK